jgi:hypothetical protein
MIKGIIPIGSEKQKCPKKKILSTLMIISVEEKALIYLLGTTQMENPTH